MAQSEREVFGIEPCLVFCSRSEAIHLSGTSGQNRGTRRALDCGLPVASTYRTGKSACVTRQASVNSLVSELAVAKAGSPNLAFRGPEGPRFRPVCWWDAHSWLWLTECLDLHAQAGVPVPRKDPGVFSTRVLLTAWVPRLHSGFLLAIVSGVARRHPEAGSVNSSRLTSKKLAGDVLG